jgi:hypothetical protein
MKCLLFFLLANLTLPAADTAINGSCYFIAMEYKGMSNCIYKVYVNDSLVLGAKVNGYITVEGSFGMGKSIPKDLMHSPEAYVDKTMDDKYRSLLSDNDAFLQADKDNFIIRKTDIKKVYNNPGKKWGMGYYPQSGRIEIEALKTPRNRRAERDLILVGDQNPDSVLVLFKQ